MKAQLQEDIYYAILEEEELSDVEHTEGDVLAQIRDVMMNRKGK